MTRLRVFKDSDGANPLAMHTDHARIQSELAALGVRFERWQAKAPIAPGASQDEVIAAYRSDIDRLMTEEGYKAVDVVSIKPDNPDRAALRQKFLSEHQHSENELRFFVAGAAQFNLHVGDKVYEVLCEAGDLIRVPDGARHWFDMSEAPYFVAIRLFTNPEGWVARFTGDDIGTHFPLMTPHPSALASMQ